MVDLSRTRFARSSGDRMLAGVAGGLAHRLGVDATVIRLCFLVLSMAGGVGMVAYLAAWSVSEDAADLPVSERPGTTERSLGLGLFTLAGLVVLREVGLWFGDEVVWPVSLAATGSALLWARTSPDDRARWSSIVSANGTGMSRSGRVLRAAVGILLVAVGLGVFLFDRVRLAALGDVAIAVLVTSAGATIVFGPWLARVARDLAAERRERVRSDERARIAAQLHDSVLQTLALMQRAADDPRRMATLARRQERELRSWLYGTGGFAGPDVDDLRSAVAQVAEDVEELYDVRIETVVVGDVRLDDRTGDLVAAVREAVANAAKHADVQEVSVFVEVGDRSVTAFVRDRGVGFDPTIKGNGGRGIPDSIVARLRRRGGSTEISSTPGEGTEVAMEVPR